MITAAMILTGLILGSGFMLRHRLRPAPSARVRLVRPGRASTARQSAARWPNQGTGRARPTRKTDPHTRRLLKRLWMEELRQQPQEGRN